MKKKTITLIGGSGFLAKYCISELLKEGHNLKIVCRNPHLAGLENDGANRAIRYCKR